MAIDIPASSTAAGQPPTVGVLKALRSNQEELRDRFARTDQSQVVVGLGIEHGNTDGGHAGLGIQALPGGYKLDTIGTVIPVAAADPNIETGVNTVAYCEHAYAESLAPGDVETFASGGGDLDMVRTDNPTKAVTANADAVVFTSIILRGATRAIRMEIENLTQLTDVDTNPVAEAVPRGALFVGVFQEAP